MADPQVTVAMGVFNPDEDRFLQAVNSIIGQSFQNWELLLYDDGSEAAAAGIIRRAAELDHRIRCIRGQHNHGLAHALNECIRRAAGAYIARMDDDDIARRDRLEKQVSFLETHMQYHWVGSNAERTDGQGVWGLQKMPEIPQKEDFLFNSPYIHPTVMFRKRELIHSGGYSESPQHLHGEDYELFIRLHADGFQGYNLQEPLLQYWEDYEAHRKRTYCRRIREMKLRYHGFRRLGVLNRNTFCYVLKPLAVGAVPAPVHHYIRRRIKRRK